MDECEAFNTCYSLRRRALIKTFLFFIFYLISFVLYARDVTVTIIDAELDIPLEGAVIRLWDGSDILCGEDGKVLINAPDDRQVVIQVRYPGYDTGRLVITVTGTEYALGLRLAGIMEGRELVVEAERAGKNETRTGRSVALSGREIAQSAEIGIIEDVMSAIKLLPGVGYTGMFNAQPSIRGGFPGDMSASLDGFYIFNPYHWGGGVSIFDPRMVQSAQLSHGVFSTRYGHTVSGLLDITTKSPSSVETEFEFGASTSSANFNLSVPFNGKGGILFMGRVTYYDPIVWLAKQAASHIDNEQFQMIHAVRVAPYIRSAAVTGNYRFTSSLELHTTGFFGMDGVGVTYENEASTSGELTSSSDMIFDFINYQAFIISSLNWNPRNDMLFKFTTGIGYEEADIDGDLKSSVMKKKFSDEFNAKYYTSGITPQPYEVKALFKQNEAALNAQGRIDYDWEIGNGFLASAGIQEMFTRYSAKGEMELTRSFKFSELDSLQQLFLQGKYTGLSPQFWKDVRIPLSYNVPSDASNNLFVTSAYALAEYNTGSRLKTELGLRMDHYYLLGKGFSLQTTPALNPRINIDINIFKNKWILDSMDISAGSGLFASMNDSIFTAEKTHDISGVKPNRAWTSVLGTKFELPERLNLNIEGYYKHIFDRMYTPITYSPELESSSQRKFEAKFDGIGTIWGIDVMLQKMQSRYWDGWISYSYSYARYRDPSSVEEETDDFGTSYGGDWYFPWFHRFHNLNLVINFKPVPKFNIYTRLGIASGTILARRIGNRPESYPVLMKSDDPDDPELKLVERYTWPSVRDESNRTTPTLSMDIKFSIFGSNKTGKARHEIYFAMENVLSLVYMTQGNTRFNTYTGEVDTGSDSANYGIPVPIPSFGFKICY